MDRDGLQLAQSVIEARQAVFDAYAAWRESSARAAEAEARYQSAKARRYVEIKAETKSATDAANRVKGDEMVNGALLARDCAQAVADADRELVNIRKLDLRCVEAQYEREWGFAGREMV